jgi:hypothetical protein
MNQFTSLVFSLYREYVAAQMQGLKMPDIEVVAVKEQLLMEWDRLKIAGEDRKAVEYLLDQVDYLLYDATGKPAPFQMLLDCCEN